MQSQQRGAGRKAWDMPGDVMGKPEGPQRRPRLGSYRGSLDGCSYFAKVHRAHERPRTPPKSLTARSAWTRPRETIRKAARPLPPLSLHPPSCPARASLGGTIPDTRGAFFLLLGGRESQVFELPRACSLSSHHSVPQTRVRIGVLLPLPPAACDPHVGPPRARPSSLAAQRSPGKRTLCFWEPWFPHLFHGQGCGDNPSLPRVLPGRRHGTSPLEPPLCPPGLGWACPCWLSVPTATTRQVL